MAISASINTYRTVFHWCMTGCGMDTLFVLVSPCFRENVVVTCKIRSFLCSLDDLLQKNVMVSFFGNQISKWRSFEKKGYFWPTFHIFSHQGKVTKIPSAHISLTSLLPHIHTYMNFASPIDFFCLTNFEKKYEFIRYGFSLYESWCWFLFAPFWNNQ